MKEVYTSQKTLKLHFVCRTWDGRDGINFGREWNNPRMVNDVAKVFDLRCSNDALLAIQGETGVAQTAKNATKILHVLLHVHTGHQNVIQVDEDPLHVAKDLVHQPLKRLSRVLQTKGHPKKLEKAKRCDDGGLFDVFWGHWNLVVSAHQVQDRKIPGPESD